MRRAVHAWLLASALGLLAPAVRADEGKVLILVAPEATALAVRIGAELEALGFTVELRPSQAGPVEPERLSADARASGAVAAVQVQRGQRRVGLWLVDRVTGKTVVREIPGERSSDEVLAVKTTELLWASLLESQRQGFVPAEVPAPAPARALLAATPLALPEPPPARVRPLVGAGLLWVGRLGSAASVVAGVDLTLGSAGFATVRISAPLTRPSLEGPEGVSYQALSSATFDLGLRSRGRRLGLGASVVGGAFWLHTSSLATSPYRDSSDDVLALLLGVRPSASLRLSRALTLRLDTTVQALIPRPRVLFARRPVAEAPRVGAELSVLAELSLW